MLHQMNSLESYYVKAHLCACWLWKATFWLAKPLNFRIQWGHCCYKKYICICIQSITVNKSSLFFFFFPSKRIIVWISGIMFDNNPGIQKPRESMNLVISILYSIFKMGQSSTGVTSLFSPGCKTFKLGWLSSS